MKILGFYPQRVNVSTTELLKSLKSHFIVINFLVSIGASVTFICKSQLNSLNFLDVIFALIYIAGIFANIGSFITFGTKMKKVKILQNELQQIIDDGTRS